VFPTKGTASLLEIASLIEGARCVITPDTSIIHFASAFKTPVVGLFTPLQRTHEWMPYHVRHQSVLAEEMKSVNTIPLGTIVRAVDAMFNELRVVQE
jgi:ADP-heptose:LPS heptosyltransferase